MKKVYLFITLIITIIVEIFIAIILINNTKNYQNDTVKINELKYEIIENFDNEDNYPTLFTYSIIDESDNLIYKNGNASNSLNEAYKNMDTIVDFSVDSNNYKILIYNDFDQVIKNNNITLVILIISMSFIQILIIALFYLYLHKRIIKPFNDMKDYAIRISNGDLDIPLKMDKYNNFGAFTESFDIMREELKKARIKEKEANDSKRELVAKLSHDIKTPVSSIKSTSELGSLVSIDEKTKNYFDIITNKADQINTLVSNLLMSSLDDLEQIKIEPIQCDSFILYELIKNSDYLTKVNKYKIDECKIFVDRVRLQQVIDNIISNSYKYANTNIDINSNINDGYLIIEFRDYGNGVNEMELPLLTEKFKRGNNSKDKDGVGLGLYISKTFINQMEGIMTLENSNPGFKVTIKLRII